MKKFLIHAAVLGLVSAACLLVCQRPAHSATLGEFVSVGVGGNGVWLDGAGSAFPADFELGASGSLALQERFKLIADGYYGVSNAYLRGDLGGKFVVSDKASQSKLAIYLVGKYRFGSTDKVRPDEWAFGAGVGLVPLPSAPNLSVGIEAARGVRSDIVLMYLAARVALPIK